MIRNSLFHRVRALITATPYLTEPIQSLYLFEVAGISRSIFQGKSMSGQRSAMRRIKDLLRLKFEANLSYRRIAAATRLSRATVSSLVERALEQGPTARGSG